MKKILKNMRLKRQAAQAAEQINQLEQEWEATTDLTRRWIIEEEIHDLRPEVKTDNDGW